MHTTSNDAQASTSVVSSSTLSRKHKAIQEALTILAEANLTVEDLPAQPSSEMPSNAPETYELMYEEVKALVADRQPAAELCFEQQTRRTLSKKVASFLTGHLITIADNENLTFSKELVNQCVMYRQKTYTEFNPGTSALQFIYNGICNWKNQEKLSEMQYQQSGIYPLVAFTFADLLQHNLQVRAYVCTVIAN